jgi:imidazolonepropionase-like amidohydrolase
MSVSWIHAARAITGDGKTVLTPVWLAIDGARIGEIRNSVPDRTTPENTTEMGDTTLAPGLINLHDHICRKALRDVPSPLSFSDRSKMLMTEDTHYLLMHSVHNARNSLRREGMTYIRDYGLAGYSTIHLKRAINEGLVEGPEMSTCGRPICQTGGHTYRQAHEADGPEKVREAVRAELRAGADIIKFMASGGLEHFPREDPTHPEFTEAELRAGAEAAHDAGVMTAAHAYATVGILRAVRAGIDSIEHGTLLTEECIDLMLKHGTTLVPTLTGLRASRTFGPQTPEMDRVNTELQARIFGPQEEGMRMAKAAGVPVGTGTDSVGRLSDEIRLFAEVLSETPVQALAHATGVAAGIIRRPDLGLLEEGRQANIVAFHGDLTKSLDVLDHVAQVWKAGRPIA